MFNKLPLNTVFQYIQVCNAWECETGVSIPQVLDFNISDKNAYYSNGLIMYHFIEDIEKTVKCIHCRYKRRHKNVSEQSVRKYVIRNQLSDMLLSKRRNILK